MRIGIPLVSMCRYTAVALLLFVIFLASRFGVFISGILWDKFMIMRGHYTYLHVHNEGFYEV
jgi:hypothetical protein